MNYKIFVSFIFVFATLTSCKKNWLDAKPDDSLVIPVSIGDYQSLLDNSFSTNSYNNSHPILGEVGAGDFYLTYDRWQGLVPLLRNAFVWEKDLFDGSKVTDWDNPYSRILKSNIVLEGIAKIVPTGSQQADWDNVRGSALFYRAFDHFCLAQLFCAPYSENTAAVELGIPLRKNADVNERSLRASVLETYNFIIQDLQEAKQLLPKLPSHKTRPSKVAADALLARTYLLMEDYDNALTHSQSSLAQYDSLMDYNSVTDKNQPFAQLNKEVIFHSYFSNSGIFAVSRLIVDSVLYRSFDKNDLRLKLFFRPATGATFTYKGSYTGTQVLFGGLATDEMYLVSAECNARKNNLLEAKNNLNSLLIKRWKNDGSFVPIASSDKDELVGIILGERRKELMFRGIRWSDLRRLNKYPQYSIVLSRNLSGEIYTLSPNDQKYVLPIPEYEIQLSGIAQNPR